MATTGTYSFSVTRDDIIRAALQDIGVVDSTGTVDPYDNTTAAMRLNMIIKQWATEGFPIWCTATATVNLLQGKQDYTMGPSADIPLPYNPVRIFDIILHNVSSGADISLIPLAKWDWDMLSMKTNAGLVNQYYFEKSIPLSTLHVYGNPTDSTSWQLKVAHQRPLQDISAATDNFDVPQDFYLALKWSLAEELGFTYSIPSERLQLIEMKAKRARDEAFALNQEDTSIYFQVDQRFYGPR